MHRYILKFKKKEHEAMVWAYFLHESVYWFVVYQSRI